MHFILKRSPLEGVGSSVPGADPVVPTVAPDDDNDADDAGPLIPWDGRDFFEDDFLLILLILIVLLLSLELLLLTPPANPLLPATTFKVLDLGAWMRTWEDLRVPLLGEPPPALPLPLTMTRASLLTATCEVTSFADLMMLLLLSAVGRSLLLIKVCRVELDWYILRIILLAMTSYMLAFPPQISLHAREEGMWLGASLGFPFPPQCNDLVKASPVDCPAVACFREY